MPRILDTSQLTAADARWLGWLLGGAIVGGFLLLVPRLLAWAGKL